VAALLTTGSAAAFTQQEVPAQCDVAGTGPGGRSIDLFYNSGGCGVPAHATAVETPTSVTPAARCGSRWRQR
jgi:hypothetical protein